MEIGGEGEEMSAGVKEIISSVAKDKEVSRASSPDGGYIFDVNTTIDYGVKHENVLAMFDAVKTYGKY